MAAPKVALGVNTAGRVALKTAARAYWLVEPGLDLRARVARYYSHRLSDLVRSAKLAEDLADQVGAEAVKESTGRRDEVAAQARAAGFTVGKLRDPVEVGGEKPPNHPSSRGSPSTRTPGGALLYDQPASSSG